MSEEFYRSLLSSAGRAADAPPALAPAKGDVINFVYGLPDAASFPTDELVETVGHVLRKEGTVALQYGSGRGSQALLEVLAARMSEADGRDYGPEKLIVTSGSSQAIALMAELLVDRGDVVVVEAPTFIGALNTFRQWGAEIVEVPIDSEGIRPDLLEEAVVSAKRRGKPVKFVYILPNFHNPAGTTMSLIRRREILDLARRWRVILLEDDAYAELRYEGSSLPSLMSMDEEGLVVRLGTFSKILAAGMRLGWAVGPTFLVDGMARVKADGGTSPFASHVAAEFARSGRLDRHIMRLRQVYREKRDAMVLALETYCGEFASWVRPEGGFFVWVQLKPSVDGDKLLQVASSEGVAYLPGRACFASGTGRQFLRLSFSFLAPEQIWEGVRRLARAMERVYQGRQVG